MKVSLNRDQAQVFEIFKTHTGFSKRSDAFIVNMLVLFALSDFYGTNTDNPDLMDAWDAVDLNRL